jgi:hypothetical protein
VDSVVDSVVDSGEDVDGFADAEKLQTRRSILDEFKIWIW